MVADLGLLGGGGLGRADVHAPVHLHRVDRDELDVAERARATAIASADFPDAVGPRWRAAPRRTRSARRRPGCGCGGAAGAVTSTSSPRRWWGAAPVTSTSARVPAPERPWRAKWTSLFWRVRPVMTRRVRLRGPSTRTSSIAADAGLVLGQRGALDDDAQPLEPLGHTSGATNARSSSAASVPGRGEKMNV